MNGMLRGILGASCMLRIAVRCVLLSALAAVLLLCACAGPRGSLDGEGGAEVEQQEEVIVGSVARTDTVRIECGSWGVPVGGALRPGIEVHFFGYEIDQLFTRFLEEMRVGLVRVMIEGAFRYSESHGQFRRHLSDHDRHIRAVVAQGGEVVIPLFPMPRWVSSTASDRLVPATPRPRYMIAPPRDYATWEDLVYEAVKHFNRDLGLDLLYEVWNEPESPEFWAGDVEEYCRLYRHAVIGARRADPDARVGGPAVGWWSSGRGRSGQLLEERGEEGLRESFLYQWLAYASSTPVREMGMERLPVGFVSWHQYGADPSYVATPAAKIRDWLGRFGYDPETPLIIDEWNSAVPGMRDGISRDPRRDTSHLAAYAAAMILAMDRAGLDGQSFFQLRRDSDHEGPQLTGDLGLVTPMGMVKPAYNALRMISMLDGHRLTVLGGDGSTFGVVAARSGVSVTVLVVNFQSEEAPLRAARQFLSDRGYGKDDLARAGLSRHQLLAIFQKRAGPEQLSLSEAECRDLEAAAALYQREAELVDARRGVVLEFVDFPGDSLVLCERYRVDEGHANLAASRARIQRHLEEVDRLSLEPALDYLRRHGFSETELSRWRDDFQAAVQAFRQSSGERRSDLRTAHDIYREERRRRMAEAAREVNAWNNVALRSALTTCRLDGQKLSTSLVLEPQAVALVRLSPLSASH